MLKIQKNISSGLTVNFLHHEYDCSNLGGVKLIQRSSEINKRNYEAIEANYDADKLSKIWLPQL